MNVYPETSFLCSLYRKQHTSSQAVAYQKSMSEPLLVSSFLLLEFRQSVRFQNRLFEKDRSKGFSKTEGAAMLRALQSDLADSILEMVAPDWASCRMESW